MEICGTNWQTWKTAEKAADSDFTGKSCALLSVSDKRGIETLAAALLDAGIQLLSTGGTADALRKAGLPVTDVSEHTGAQEMMAGRVRRCTPSYMAVFWDAGDWTTMS